MKLIKKLSKNTENEVTRILSELSSERSILPDMKKYHFRIVNLSKAKSGMYLGFGLILLNARYVGEEAELINAKWLNIIAHEMEHARHGAITAFSVYGELQAWQAGFRVLEQYGNKPLSGLAKEILNLPITKDRGVLRRAQELMRLYAGDAYGIQNRTLYPIFEEIKYRLGGGR